MSAGPAVLPAGARSFRHRVLLAGGWTAAGYGLNQVIRFGSNLILTRLLFPEAFGLMAIVQTVLIGVTMLSDIGVTQSIVRNPRGAEEAFVNTAWTIQVAKGIVIALLLLVGSGTVARAYGQPMLHDLLSLAAIVALVTGFNSTNIAAASRRVDAVRVTINDSVGLAIGIAVSILLALHNPTPFALVIGNVVGAICKMIGSHVYLPGPRNRLAWDRDAARSVFSFGASVILSSTITFLTGEGNKLVSASLVSVHLLALMGLAGTLNTVFWQAIQQVSANVLFPAYSEILRKDPSRFSRVVERARLIQIVPAWLLSLVFAIWGSEIIGLLYDHRYAGAGIVLQVIALGTMVGILTGSYSDVLWSMGKIGTTTAMTAIQMGLQWVGMLVGAHIAGPLGLVIGVAMAGWLIYPFTAVVYGRLGLWHPRIDIPVLIASSIACVVVIATADWTVARSW